MIPTTILSFIALSNALTLGPTTNFTAPSPNDIPIQCNGRQFGHNLNYASCLDAFSTFPLGASLTPLRISRRREGTFNRALPWKWVSGDGRCTFDMVMRGTAPSETTTGAEIARAAWRLLNECARDQGGLGGVASGIGERETLGIILRSYDPTAVQCGARTESFSDDKCSDLLHTIPAQAAPSFTWGPSGQAGVDNVLPFEYFLGGDRCRLNVWGAYGNQNLRDRMTMYELWTAGEILAGMCARFDKAGKYEHLGANGRLWVLLDAKPVNAGSGVADA